jgi:uncharacterized protein YhhL (DUF1145 family)
MHIIMLSLGQGVLFTISVTRSIIVLFHIRIELVYYSETLRVSYVSMFTSNTVLLFGMIYLLSVADNLVALTIWNCCNSNNYF